MKTLDWILRGFILALVGVLFVPTIKLPKLGARVKVLLLVDASASMSGSGKQKEWARIREELNKLRSQTSWISYSFSGDVKPLGSLYSIEFKGSSTDIYRALEGLDVKNVDAILLVSDGRHNGPEELSTLSSLKPLWAVVVGQKGLQDMGIEEAFFEQDDSTRLRIRLRSSGLDKQKVRLRIKGEGASEISRYVELEANQLTEIVTPILQDLESKVWRIELDTLPAEDRTDNNFFTLINPQIDSKIKVLFVASRISEETEIILETLKGLHDVMLTKRIEISPGGVIANSSLEKPDVILVGPVSKNLSKSTLETIRGAASAGIPIMFIGGDDLPQELESYFPLQPGVPSGGNSNINSTPLADLLFSKWEEGINEVTQGTQTPYRTKPNASALLSVNQNTVMAKSEKPARTLAVELPTIAESIRKNREGFAYFLQASLVYLHEGEAFPFSVVVERSNETALRLDLSSAVEIEQPALEAWLSPDSHPLSVLPFSSRSFRATGTAPRGEYRLNLSWRGQRFTLRDRVTVAPAEPERPSRGANPDLLQAITRNNSGGLVAVEEIKELVCSLPKRMSSQFKPLNTPWVVILAGVFMLAEIWYRRRNGLP